MKKPEMKRIPATAKLTLAIRGCVIGRGYMVLAKIKLNATDLRFPLFFSSKTDKLLACTTSLSKHKPV